VREAKKWRGDMRFVLEHGFERPWRNHALAVGLGHQTTGHHPESLRSEGEQGEGPALLQPRASQVDRSLATSAGDVTPNVVRQNGRTYRKPLSERPMAQPALEMLKGSSSWLLRSAAEQVPHPLRLAHAQLRGFGMVSR
jgi:hypothetical protein